MNHTNIADIPLGEVVTAGKFLVDQHPIVVLFDLGALHSFISPAFASKFMQKTYTVEGECYCIRAASGTIPTKLVVGDVQLKIEGQSYQVDLVVLPGLGIDLILGMNWMSSHGVLINTSTRVVMLRDPSNQEGFLVQLSKDINLSCVVNAVQAKVMADILVVCDFPDVFSDDLPRLRPDRDVEFKIELLLVLRPCLEDLIECLPTN